MDFVSAVKSCFAQYAGFSGRAPRSEFWWFALFQLGVLVIATLISQVLYGIAALALLLPALAVGARRLHDIGRSGWLCSASACDTGSAIPPNATLPPITVSMPVPATAEPLPRTMAATVTSTTPAVGLPVESQAVTGTAVGAVDVVASWTKVGPLRHGTVAPLQVTVANPGSSATAGPVTVSFDLPRPAAVSGPGWTCPARSWSRGPKFFQGSPHPERPPPG